MASINEVMPFAQTLFLTILVIGVTYILASLFLGGLGDFDIDMGDVDAGDGSSDAFGLSLSAIAAFCVGTGAVGTVASLNDWSFIVTILVSLLFGLILGRFLQSLMSFVLRQEGGDVIKTNDIIGAVARITVNIPTGRLGEAMIEEPYRMKNAVKHIDDAPLQKGDKVVVIDIEGGHWLVRKQNNL